MAPPLGYTPNGWERQMGVNHFGHFALTQMLRGRLQSQSHPSRVVVLASTAHSIGKVDVGDLHYSKGRRYSAWGAYGQVGGSCCGGVVGFRVLLCSAVVSCY
jgi:NAD(P)-dependent dehydrogenase (short-subunit alcohol dehydrogenase family)